MGKNEQLVREIYHFVYLSIEPKPDLLHLKLSTQTRRAPQTSCRRLGYCLSNGAAIAGGEHARNAGGLVKWWLYPYVSLFSELEGEMLCKRAVDLALGLVSLGN